MIRFGLVLMIAAVESGKNKKKGKKKTDI